MCISLHQLQYSLKKARVYHLSKEFGQFVSLVPKSSCYQKLFGLSMLDQRINCSIRISFALSSRDPSYHWLNLFTFLRSICFSQCCPVNLLSFACFVILFLWMILISLLIFHHFVLYLDFLFMFVHYFEKFWCVDSLLYMSLSKYL